MRHLFTILKIPEHINCPELTEQFWGGSREEVRKLLPVYTLSPGRNDRRFEDIFKRIFLKEIDVFWFMFRWNSFPSV